MKSCFSAALLLPLALPFALGGCAVLGARSPFAFGKKGELVDFNYSWPAEVSASPRLARRFQRDLDRAFASTLAAATADRAAAAADGRSFRGHQYSVDWNSAGQSRRLLSLTAAMTSFTGGAHGNKGNKALLWDRRGGRDLSVASLFASPAGYDALVRPATCKALDDERRRKRSGSSAPGGAFDACPTLGQLSTSLVDRDRNARFDHLRIVADPYVAGPWSEGDYAVELPVTATLLAAIRPAWRADFEVAQPQ